MAEVNIEITRGDDYLYEGAATLDAVAYNISGALEIAFTVKRNKRDALADALIAKTLGSGVAVVSGAGGTYRVTIDAADTEALTGPFYGSYDVEITKSDGKKDTVAYGTFTVLMDVTTPA